MSSSAPTPWNGPAAAPNTAPSGTSPALPAPKKKGHGGAIAAVIVIIILAVAGLWYLGYLPGKSSSSSPSPPTPLSYSQAEPGANNYAQEQSGAPWQLNIAGGISFGSSTPVNTTASSGEPCPSTPSSFTTWPADSAGVGSGKTPLWLFEFRSQSGAELGVLDNGGTYTTAYSWAAGSSCVNGPSSPLPTSGLIDSTTAASVADSAGASAFLSANTGADDEYVLYQSGSFGTVWYFEYSLCLADTGKLSGVEATFSAEVNATTGSVVSSSTSTATCGSGPSKPYTLGLGPVGTSVNPAGNTFYDNFSVSPSAGLTTALFALKITTPSANVVPTSAAVCSSASGGFVACSAPPTGTWYAVLVGPTGTWLASFPSSSGGSIWNGGTVAVSAADSLAIISSGTLAGSGDSMTVYGVNGASATGSVTL
jgi:hypothetical protein